MSNIIEVKSQFRVLVLILSSPGKAYRRFKDNWNIYANSHCNIDTYFMEMNEIDNEYEIKDRTITFKGTESIVPGCLDKTIKSLNHFDLSKYAYVVRTNLSSVIHYTRLYDFLYDKPRNRYYAGVLFKIAVDINNQVSHFNHHIFCSGALFIMSTDVAMIVANEKNYMKTVMYDDVYIGHTIINHFKSSGGITLVPLKRVDDQLVHTDTTCFHYRFKTDNRIKDTIQHRIMVEKIYGKPKVDTTSLIISKYQEYLQLKDNKFLVILRDYASLVSSIATYSDQMINWTLLAGLIDQTSSKDRKLRIVSPTLNSSLNCLARATRNVNIDFLFIRNQSSKLPSADMHIITNELNQNKLSDITELLDSAKANKIIIYRGDVKLVSDSSKIWQRAKIYPEDKLIIWTRIH